MQNTKASETEQAETVRIVEDFQETLTEIRVDDYEFRVTWHPLEPDSCIVWFRDRRITSQFEALGKLGTFDRRRILLLITDYTTDPDLRRRIHLRRFERKIEGLTPTFFAEVDRMSRTRKEEAFRRLYDLDTVVDSEEIKRKRRLMARQFHPDAGGDHRSMSLINEGFDFLMATLERSP